MARQPEPRHFRYCVEFSKDGPARFVSHLDMQAGMERALRRARLPLAFSLGYHPRPRMRFEEALPLGWTSDCERLWVDFTQPYPSREAWIRLCSEAPPGLTFHRVFPWEGRPVPARRRVFAVTGVALPEDTSDRVVAAFPASSEETGPVCAERLDAAWRFTLTGGEQPAPSMKKVLKTLLGDDLPPELAVRRLAPDRGAGL